MDGPWLIVCGEAGRAFWDELGGNVLPVVAPCPVAYLDYGGIPVPVFLIDRERVPLDDVPAWQRRVARHSGRPLAEVERRWPDLTPGIPVWPWFTVYTATVRPRGGAG